VVAVDDDIAAVAASDWVAAAVELDHTDQFDCAAVAVGPEIKIKY